MRAKIAINGFGRIGRAAFKNIIDDHPKLELVAINDLTDIQTLRHLLKYDSAYGRYKKEIKIKDDAFLIDGKRIKVISEPNPEKLPWNDLGVDVVLECTGRFISAEGSGKHLIAGAKKVIISANSKAESVPHFVLGVNEGQYQPKKDNIVANCSCTTNCAVPVINILHQRFEILTAQMITIHAVTSTQRLVDGPHRDWRRARSAFVNVIPTTTGADEAVVRVLPGLKERISGSAIRVPVICGSLLEVIAWIAQKTSAEEVNNIFKKEAETTLKNILSVSNELLVSSDIIGTTASAIIDLPLTEIVTPARGKGGCLVKVIAWYDNEWAYACRLIELAEYIAQRL